MLAVLSFAAYREVKDDEDELWPNVIFIVSFLFYGVVLRYTLSLEGRERYQLPISMMITFVIAVFWPVAAPFYYWPSYKELGVRTRPALVRCVSFILATWTFLMPFFVITFVSQMFGRSEPVGPPIDNGRLQGWAPERMYLDLLLWRASEETSYLVRGLVFIFVCFSALPSLVVIFCHWIDSVIRRDTGKPKAAR